MFLIIMILHSYFFSTAYVELLAYRHQINTQSVEFDIFFLCSFQYHCLTFGPVSNRQENYCNDKEKLPHPSIDHLNVSPLLLLIRLHGKICTVGEWEKS